MSQLIAGLFYFTGVPFFIFFEMVSYSYAGSLVARINMKKEDRPKASIQMSVYFLTALFYIFFSLVGLATSQWVWFAILAVIGMLHSLINWMVGRSTVWLVKFDSVLSVLLMIFIIINKYHLHILQF